MLSTAMHCDQSSAAVAMVSRSTHELKEALRRKLENLNLGAASNGPLSLLHHQRSHIARQVVFSFRFVPSVAEVAEASHFLR
jgi:hypothetical protein